MRSRNELRAEAEAAGHTAVKITQAIRAKCLDCVGGSASEVSKCSVRKCALYPFRFGKNPWSNRTGGFKPTHPDAQGGGGE